MKIYLHSYHTQVTIIIMQNMKIQHTRFAIYSNCNPCNCCCPSHYYHRHLSLSFDSSAHDAIVEGVCLCVRIVAELVCLDH